MSNPMEEFTRQALAEFGSAASAEFYRRLQDERKMCATQCADCGEAAFPPRMHCPKCFGDAMQWVEITSEMGATLVAFTTQSRGLRFTAPEVIGVVDVPDIGMFISPISGTMDTLKIGQSLRPEIVDIHPGLCFYRYVPV